MKIARTLALLALAGCSLLRPNPLDEKRGAVVLVFDLRGNLDVREMRRMLSACDVRATFFAAGRITRGTAAMLKDLSADGHDIGLSGLKGFNPQTYVSTYGLQKYFQDEVVTQVLDAERQNLNLRHFLLHYPTKMKAEALKLPPFLVSKGFLRVVDVMPEYVKPEPVPASRLSARVVHAYQLTEEAFDRTQIASLAKRNEVLVVAPDLKILPELIKEAQTQGVPFATLADLRQTRSESDREHARTKEIAH